ncbi:MAG: zinc metallopeptidase [Clostridiaceae bacterium]
MSVISAIGAFMPYLDPTILILLPALIFSGWAQSKVSSTYQQYSKVGNQRGLTGAQVARFILDNAGLQNITIEPVRGQLTDHYDPRGKVLRLSEGVFGSQSVAAIGVASHEVGHAIQDATNYGPMKLRGAIVPLAAIGGNLSMVLILFGLFLGGTQFVQIGMFLFLFTVIFQLVTLPVEFDASKRALRILNTGILSPGELEGAKKVLNAAALTYVAAAISGILNFLRLVLLTRRRN